MATKDQWSKVCKKSDIEIQDSEFGWNATYSRTQANLFWLARQKKDGPDDTKVYVYEGPDDCFDVKGKGIAQTTKWISKEVRDWWAGHFDMRDVCIEKKKMFDDSNKKLSIGGGYKGRKARKRKRTDEVGIVRRLDDALSTLHQLEEEISAIRDQLKGMQQRAMERQKQCEKQYMMF
eukprot:818953_1